MAEEDLTEDDVEKKPPTLKGLVSGFQAAGARAADLEKWVRTGKGEVEGDAQLVSWDANSIHAFVFSTTNASGIRGASDYLAEIDASLRSGVELGLSPSQILFAGGGSGMAVVEEAQVSGVAEALHKFFARKSLIATCSVGSVPLAGGRFHEQIAAVSREMTRSRLEIGPDPEPFVPFFAERCRVCGQRAAAKTQPRANDPARLECLPCHRSVNRGKIDKGKRGEKSVEEQSFQEIADREEGGYYAVLYADGNGVGNIIQTLCSPWQYARFSYLLDYLVSQSFDAIVERYGLKKETGDLGTKRAHQKAICAGDDIVAIVPGEIAVPLARDLLKDFEERVAARPVHPDLDTSDLDLTGLALSAGVTMAQVRMPVRHLLQEAEELLKRAKSRHYSRPDRSIGLSSLDFSVLRDGSPRAEVPEELESVVAWSLAKNPLERPSASELAAAYRQALERIEAAEARTIPQPTADEPGLPELELARSFPDIDTSAPTVPFDSKGQPGLPPPKKSWLSGLLDRLKGYWS